MKYIEKSRIRNRWKIRLANILNGAIFFVSLICWMLGVASIEGNPLVCGGMILAGSIGIVVTLKGDDKWGQS